MNKNSIQRNNTIKLKKNRVKDKKLRQLDNKLHRINKKIDLASQRNFILNRIIKDINNSEKTYCKINLARIIKTIKVAAIKTLIFMVYLTFKLANQKKSSLIKKFLNCFDPSHLLARQYNCFD